MNLKQRLILTGKTTLMVALLLGAINARASDSNLTDTLPKAVSVTTALKAYKDARPVFKCNPVELTENKSGSGLSFKKVKKSKVFLALDFVGKNIDQLLTSKEVFKCVEAEPNLTANGVNFKNK